MKYAYSLLLCFFLTTVYGQIRGNQKMTTKSYNLSNITEIEVNLYAEIEVDMIIDEGLKITIDENLVQFVGISLNDGRLVLDQKKWIQPSQDVIIKIGAPNLKFIQQGTHETTNVTNINAQKFSAMANVGKIKLSGRADYLTANVEVGNIDARSLKAKVVDLNIWSWGSVELDNPSKITGKVKENGSVLYTDNQTEVTARTRTGGTIRDRNKAEEMAILKTKYIDIRLKNNSRNRINAYVRGPKPDGKYFSYGFPMNPGQVKKERWTVGTKVFRRTNIGLKKLLVEIVEKDEGSVVKLYND